jgi:hypothetical protein
LAREHGGDGGTRGPARERFDSTVDLFGEQTVQALVAAFQVATALLGVLLLLLVSVQLARSAAVRLSGAVVPPPRTGRMARPARLDVPSTDGLRTCLPARAPPDVGAPPGFGRDPFHRPCPSRPAGEFPLG